ncbi:MAG: polysaccharide deacetylase family protein [Candidatus Omnitrophota bacterium]
MTDDKIILMYHGITEEGLMPPSEREVGADLYDVRVEDFSAQLELIRKKGLGVKKIEEAGTNDIVITFDDGEFNNFSLAMPLLKQHQFPAYFFVITKRVGRPGYVRMEEIKEMVKQGMIVGSHGMSHEALTNLKDTLLNEELSASKKYLERNLGITINDLSIPRGFCNDKVLDMAYAAGYKNVFISGRPKDLVNTLCHSRVAVKKNWDLKRFEMALDRQVPIKETLTEKTKNFSKLILRENGYNWIRSTLLKLFKG